MQFIFSLFGHFGQATFRAVHTPLALYNYNFAAKVARICCSKSRSFTPSSFVSRELSMEMSAGLLTPRSTDAAGTGFTLSSVRPNTPAVT